MLPSDDPELEEGELAGSPEPQPASPSPGPAPAPAPPPNEPSASKPSEIPSSHDPASAGAANQTNGEASEKDKIQQEQEQEAEAEAATDKEAEANEGQAAEAEETSKGDRTKSEEPSVSEHESDESGDHNNNNNNNNKKIDRRGKGLPSTLKELSQLGLSFVGDGEIIEGPRRRARTHHSPPPRATSSTSSSSARASSTEAARKRTSPSQSHDKRPEREPSTHKSPEPEGASTLTLELTTKPKTEPPEEPQPNGFGINEHDTTMAEALADEGEMEGDEGETRCICGSEEESIGLMIQCDTCHCWQHCVCMGMEGEDECPDVYYCEQCRPDLHIRLLRDLGYLARSKKSPHTSRRNGTATQAELEAAKIAVQMAIKQRRADRAAASSAGHHPTTPGSTSNPYASRRNVSPTTSLASHPRSPKRRATMNSRDSNYGWEPIPAHLLAEGAEEEPKRREASQRKRKRSSPPEEDEPEEEEQQEKKLPTRKAGRKDHPKTNHNHSNNHHHQETLAPPPSQSQHTTHESSPSPTKPTKGSSRASTATREPPTTNKVYLPPAAAAAASAWKLPEHLMHLAHILPPAPVDVRVQEAVASGKKVPGKTTGGSYALETRTESASKIRFPARRTTMGEMRKRIRAIGEYVMGAQIEAASREARWRRMGLTRLEGPPSTGGTTPADPSLSSSASATTPAGKDASQLLDDLNRKLYQFSSKYGSLPGASTAVLRD